VTSRSLAALASTLLCAACSPEQRHDDGASARSSSTAQDPAARWVEGSWRATPSGLAYRVLEPGGGGKPPGDHDKVAMRYSIYLANGDLVASSSLDAAPTATPASLPMPGWRQALKMMAPGAHYLLRIPPELAYGAGGIPPKIPPNATIHLDLVLESIQRIPRFRRLDPERAQLGPNGILFEVEVEGAGRPPKPSDTVHYQLTYWTRDGTLVESSHYQDEPYRGRVFERRPTCVRDALRIMRPGSTVWLEVPNVHFLDPRDRPSMVAEGKPTYWRLELLRVSASLPTPEFALPSPAETQQTASGLRYQVLRPGAGEPPSIGDRIAVHYAGWLADGTLFDTTYSGGEPETLGLGSAIAGWREGLRLMRPGAIYRFVMPPELAYGEAGQPPKIPPRATLVFQIELLEVLE
jgi:FKBP-type peptidyl-prolyl cis-trans isomerase